MSLLSLALNVIWIVFGGAWMALSWAVAGVILAITIIGLPWTRSAFTLALYCLAPFGRTVVNREALEGGGSAAGGLLGLIGNLIWLVLAGWWLALEHLIIAVGFAVTIIGLPFAWAHLKLALLSLWPVGKTVVPCEGAAPVNYPRRR